jgi:peptide/nickel transport system permease protein
MKAGESEAARAFRRSFNLDKPWPVGYYLWLKGIVTRGDFGVSITVSLGKPVSELIAERLPVTVKLNLWAMVAVYLISIPAGIYAAVYRDTLGDRALTVFFFLLYSMPSFWVGLMLVLAASRYAPGWPVSGATSTLPAHTPYLTLLADTARHYVLPVLCLSYAGFASLSRFARSGLLEVIQQDYIRTARAKGLPERSVIFKHALRNGVIPLVTLFAGMLPGLIGGAVLIEYVFDIPGMGLLMLQALGSRDYPVMITVFALVSALTLIGILLSDLLYALVDPRITFD